MKLLKSKEVYVKKLKRILKLFIITFILVVAITSFFGVVYESQGLENVEAGAGWLLIYRYTKKESGFNMDFGLGIFIIITAITYIFNIFIVRYYPRSIFSRLFEKNDKGVNLNKNENNKAV